MTLYKCFSKRIYKRLDAGEVVPLRYRRRIRKARERARKQARYGLMAHWIGNAQRWELAASGQLDEALACYRTSRLAKGLDNG